MAKARKKRKSSKARSPKQRAATAKLVAHNKRKRGGKKAKKRAPHPTKFQTFLMNHPAQARKKMKW